MTNYILVHGGGSGGWCWEPMVPYLRENPRIGEIVALDLVGHGSRLQEKPQDQIDLGDYIDDVASVIRKQDLRNVVLVGHSMAGAIIPQAASHVHDRIKRLVFVSALIPRNGKSVGETLHDVGLSTNYSEEDLQKYLRHALCNDVDETTARWLLSKIGTKPPGGLAEPVNRSPLAYNIPMTYVILTMDHALSPEVQRSLATNIGGPEIVELESGHLAMISHPKELAQILLRYA